MKRGLLVAMLSAILLVVAACTREVEVVKQVEVIKEVVVTPTPRPTLAPPAPRNLTVLVGEGQDTVVISQFLPKTVRIRAGDTVTWKINTDESHTVTFLSGDEPPDFAIPVPGGGPKDLMLNPKAIFPTLSPGAAAETYSGTGYYNSGIMYKNPPSPSSPPNDSFTLTFDAPGSYDYVDLRHPLMKGTVIVEEAVNIASIPDQFSRLLPKIPHQADIDAQADKELIPLLVQIDKSREVGRTARSETGPHGTTIWHVQAGAVYIEPAAELLEFLPKELTVREGDTVTWTAKTVHSVNFHPGRPHPQLIVAKFQGSHGPPLLTINPEIAFPTKPSGVFDGTGFWSSGYLGAAALPGGTTYSMTFSKPGSYKYSCAIHRDLGMEGTITVVPR